MDTPSRVGRTTHRDSNSNPISPVPSGPEEADEEEEEEEVAEETEAATGLDHCQSESYHWCEEDDLTSSEAATSTDKTIGSSGEPDHSAEEYAEMAKKVDQNLAHIDMENFKSADLFQTEQIRSLLIEYNRPILRSQSPLSQVRNVAVALAGASKNSCTVAFPCVSVVCLFVRSWEGGGRETDKAKARAKVVPISLTGTLGIVDTLLPSIETNSSIT